MTTGVSRSSHETVQPALDVFGPGEYNRRHVEGDVDAFPTGNRLCGAWFGLWKDGSRLLG